MGRPKGSTNKPKGDKAPPKSENEKPEGETAAPASDRATTSKDNSKPRAAKEPLTDQQQHDLTAHHAGGFTKALADKKKYDADFKNYCKKIKADGISVASVKKYIDLQTEEGQERLKEEVAEMHRLARWAGMPVGAQMSFFEDEDRTPSVEKAEAEGRRAGLQGETANPPSHYGVAQQQAWLQGWHAGQKVLSDRIKQKNDGERAEDAKAFDDANKPAAATVN